jgi:hypothetical protein
MPSITTISIDRLVRRPGDVGRLRFPKSCRTGGELAMITSGDTHAPRSSFYEGFGPTLERPLRRHNRSDLGADR